MEHLDTTLDIGHTQVAYQRSGDGPDLLFIHGWPLNGHTWRGATARLEDSYTCHVIDLPGAGQSRATARTPLSLLGHVDSVLAVMDDLDLQDVTLVGHDSGGMVARRVASAQGARVRALILAGTEIPAHHSILLRTFVHGTSVPGVGPSLRRALGIDSLLKSRLLFGATVADATHLEGEFHRLFIQPLLDDDELWDSQLQVLSTLNFRDVDELEPIHAELTMPTLLLWGGQDPFFPVAKAEAMQHQFGGPTSFVSLPEASLLVHDEYPDWFAEQARAFLDVHVASREDQTTS